MIRLKRVYEEAARMMVIAHWSSDAWPRGVSKKGQYSIVGEKSRAELRK
jgi:uncharacterized protein YeaO (DUF488 family)